MSFVLLLDPTKDRDGVLHGRLVDEHLLKPAFECGVLLYVLAVLVERCRTDHAQFPSSKHGLEHVSGIHRRVTAGARTDNGVKFVDERDYLTVGLLDLIEDRL